MSYTHIIVKMHPIGKANAIKHIETDLEKEFVLNNIINPYVQGSTFFLDGARIDSSKVESIKVFESEKEYSEVYNDVKNKAEIQRRKLASQGGFVMPMGITKESAIISGETKEVTRDLFNEAQGL
ncbi:hypothetical protein TH60_05940 [Pantoea ananatis]|uniref:hypothetical protein n=1 Tax=Pantoea ananas TaxID=553 RepID=UPI000ED2DFF4|nr:hypothetical protein [Pantoea ananatis]MDC7868856.1 hypothetical protein [Pantoea ananatis]HCN00698.1 hypothetical protein [Pantoea ananatis]